MEVYPPVVAFRETIIADLANDGTAHSLVVRIRSDVLVAKTDLVEGSTPNKRFVVQIRALPIPANITAFLENTVNQNMLRMLLVKSQATLEGKLKAKEAERAREDENVPEGKGTDFSRLKVLA